MDDRDHVSRSMPAMSRREHGLVQRVRRRLRQVGLPLDAPLLVGFSGGADSLALLGAVAALQRAELVQARAIHVDHRLRLESEGEGEVARRVADALGIAFELVVLEPDRMSRHRGVGIEEAARRERYQAFAEVAGRYGAETVALGHHQQDQAETVLLHLARGAGLSGAVGMSSLTTVEVPWWRESESGPEVSPRSLRVWRPFLDESVAEVRAFARSLRLPIVEDASNDDRRLRRNAIRHEVLPALERAVPGAVAGLARFGALAAEDDAELERQAGRTLLGGVVDGALRRAGLVALPLALRRRVVRSWILGEALGLDLAADRVEAVLRVVEQPGGCRTVEVGQGVAVVIEGDELRIDRPGKDQHG